MHTFDHIKDDQRKHCIVRYQLCYAAHSTFIFICGYIRKLLDML